MSKPACRLLLLLLAFAGCGPSDDTPTKPAVVTPVERRVGQGYVGDALVTAEPHLRVHTGPGIHFPSVSPPAANGTTVLVRGSAPDEGSGQLFADIGRGYVDARWLTRLAPMPGCHRAFDDAYAALPIPAPTRALLSVVAFAEGTGNCYHYMFGYAPMVGYEAHPRTCQPFRTTCSTAAGRYQFLARTWDLLAARLALPSFEPKAQDQGAQQLFADRGFTDFGEPLSFVRFKVGIEQISWEWASLPPGRYGQGMRSMSVLWEKYQKYLTSPGAVP